MLVGKDLESWTVIQYNAWDKYSILAAQAVTTKLLAINSPMGIQKDPTDTFLSSQDPRTSMHGLPTMIA